MPGGVRITLEGDERLIARLLELGETGRRETKLVLQACVDHVRNRAIEGIQSGPKTGRVYKRGGTAHTASRMGEYPAADTGVLAGLIWDEVSDASPAGDGDPLSITLSDLADAEGQLIGQIGADAEYAAPLEYKPQGRGGRPFMRRALDESRDFVRAAFRGLRGKFRP